MGDGPPHFLLQDGEWSFELRATSIPRAWYFSEHDIFLNGQAACGVFR